MPHISKRLLEKEQFERINKQLYKIIDSLVKTGKTKLILDEILTKTEKIMLSKRLAIIVMLDHGETIYAIENTLKVSPSTVARIQLSYSNGSYTGLLKEIKAQKSLWVLFTKIIPPRVGRDRFKNFLKF